MKNWQKPKFKSSSINLLTGKKALCTTLFIAMLGTTNAQAGTYHVMESGESLTELSERFGISIEELVKANEISNKQLIPTGKKIVIPNLKSKQSKKQAAKTNAKKQQKKRIASKSATYRVQRNDTLTAIARDFNVSLSELLAFNNLDHDYMLRYGDLIKIPSSSKKTVKAAANKTMKSSKSVKKATKKPQKQKVAKSTGSDMTKYRIQRSDTLIGIANTFKVSVSDLADANSMHINDELFYGNVIVIPPPSNQY